MGNADLKQECNNANKLLSPVFCPDCEKRVKLIQDLNTDWYGNLKYYRCRNCKETFISQNGGEIEIAARH
jgi:predicted SprT family Zn-dependent metalloprotease